MQIQFNTEIWKEGSMYVVYAPQLDVSSCGKTIPEAKKNILEAVELFLEAAANEGTLKQILEEAGFSFGTSWKAPKIVASEMMKLAF